MSRTQLNIELTPDVMETFIALAKAGEADKLFAAERLLEKMHQGSLESFQERAIYSETTSSWKIRRDSVVLRCQVDLVEDTNQEIQAVASILGVEAV